MCHGLLEWALEEAFDAAVANLLKANAQRSGANAIEDDPDAESASDLELHVPEQDLNLPEPVKDQTHEQRQGTFRGNAVVWMRSKPTGRLYCFRKVIRVQQANQRLRIYASSTAAKVKEDKRRMRGLKPRFKVLTAA